MPFYTFKCPSCNIEEELLQGMNDDLPICKRCDESSVGIHIPTMLRVFKANAKPASKDGSWGFSK
jgi:putative FmdB family regulatory protein|tara:strand:+ start:1571 stop:1765 length:195 start_codon:yes stop_codon:yes gene_type:complete